MANERRTLPLNLVWVLYMPWIRRMPSLVCLGTIKSAQCTSVKSAPAFKIHRIPPTHSWECETSPYLDGQFAVGGEHFSPCFREHPLQPLFHHLREPAGPRIVSSAHKLQNWSTDPQWAHQHTAFLRWRHAHLFSAGSCWSGWASTAPLGRAGPLPSGGTAAGLRSAYHDRMTPRHPERQREGKPSRPQSRDKPLSCWGNQRPSPPGVGGGEIFKTHNNDAVAFTVTETILRAGCRICQV